jgi:hypothetical protein
MMNGNADVAVCPIGPIMQHQWTCHSVDSSQLVTHNVLDFLVCVTQPPHGPNTTSGTFLLYIWYLLLYLVFPGYLYSNSQSSSTSLTQYSLI